MVWFTFVYVNNFWSCQWCEIIKAFFLLLTSYLPILNKLQVEKHSVLKDPRQQGMKIIKSLVTEEWNQFQQF